ncbi:RNA 2',3'-cyclic phosphodiesterase [Sphingomonas canadensis]|uniref:RNA 2',3'-cyclic phosphodiesterase n=1 Tax=Sphingomonas canadensis TaxID=1219257 RepID=A0ABW3H8R2_9SPHN|nr:RNA 2',3'-cyclic phosphodiesterase [Sphingomonas canadensis]MCW3837335.1 RNA 2',3'-cyclic phosphodiesterase [Sphingomonas canadensis]
MHRLFLGLRPPGAIRARLLSLMGGIPGARWQEDDQLHVTVRFIGAVDRPAAEDAVAAIDALRLPAAEAALCGTGAFDTRGRLNSVWAGLSPREPLERLHRKVDQALARMGLEPERRAYLPHITLARLNAPPEAAAAFLAAHAALASDPFAFDRLILFESRLGHGAARYEPVADWPLG